LDIGPETLKEFQKEIDECQTIIWNGPMWVLYYAYYVMLCYVM
jgi:3-phosphoglycerate kinase